MSAPIVERLRRVESGDGIGEQKTCWYRNPDGPEAADTIVGLLIALKDCKDVIEIFHYGGDFQTAYIFPESVLAKAERVIAKAEGKQ